MDSIISVAILFILIKTNISVCYELIYFLVKYYR